MITKYITYGKNKQEKLDNKLGSRIFLSCPMLNLMMILQLTMSVFTYLAVDQ